MNVFISVDMEGIAGVSHRELVLRDKEAYRDAVGLMLGETNAAIAGAFDAGASSVTVNDSHGDMFNLPPAGLDPRAGLIAGRKPLGMVQGADGGFDLALFVGYHARAGASGNLAHTMYTAGPTEIRLNGRPVGEAGLNAAYLATCGVPVGLVTGDDVLAGEVSHWLPAAERVVVKRAVAHWAADSVHPTVACRLVREGATRAVERRRAGDLPRPSSTDPVEIEIEFHFAGQAEYATLIPGVERTGTSSVRLTAEDAATAYRTTLAALALGLLAA